MRLQLASPASLGQPPRRPMVVLCGESPKGGKDNPASNPNYRRSSQNEYWRKRPAERKSSRGPSVSSDNDKRRRGRSAHLPSPDDTPLRDGNRDRLMGLLTERAARTLEASVGQVNPALHRWLRLYSGEHGPPRDGNWSDVSGENFLRTLLTKPVEEISGSFSEEDDTFVSASPIGGDPRAIAQRVMDLRHAIAKEWIQELKMVKEENSLLLNESLMKSMQAEGLGSSSGAAAAAAPAASAEAGGSSQGGDAPVSAKSEGSGKAGQQAEGGKKQPKPVDIEALDESAGGDDD